MESSSAERALTVLDYWRIICAAKWMIAALVVGAALVTGIVSKSLPKTYEAKLTLLPAREESLGGGMSLGGGGGSSKGGSSGGGGGAGMVLDALGGKAGATLQDVLHVFLTSRAMAERIVEELNLATYYGTESATDAVDAVRGETKVTTNQYKAFEIIVSSRDPQVAANIANAYYRNLDYLYRTHTITTARRNRLFIEARLAEKTKKLDEAEEALRDFQTKNRIPGGGEAHTEGVVQQAGDLHGQIVGLEVELAVMREYATSSHPMVKELEAKISELRHQLDKIEQDEAQGLGKKRPPLSRKVFPAYEEAPALGLELLRLTRKVRVEEAVYGMLVGMLESARLAEVRDLPVLQVMDSAVPPRTWSKPKPVQYVLAATALSLVLGIVLAVFLDYLERLRALERIALGRSMEEADDLLPATDDDSMQLAGVRGASPREADRLPN